jgi:predicted nucleic acid-binding protein
VRDVVILEIGHWATSIENYGQLREDFSSLFTWVPLPDDVFHKVQKLQRSLVQIGAHRSVKIPDLCIAATAAMHDLTVLHYDHDFELIATAASVRQEWVVKRAPSVDGWGDVLRNQFRLRQQVHTRQRSSWPASGTRRPR